MSEELTTTRSIEVITAEIRTLTGSVLAGIIEIGRRLMEAKALLPHGEFGPWLTSIGYKSSTANNFMRLFDAYGNRQGNLFGAEVENLQAFGNLGYGQALALLAVPEEEREDFAKEVHADELTLKELREAIAERDAAKKALQVTEARLQDTQRTLADSDKQITDLRNRLVDAQNDIRTADEQAEENERRLEERIKELENRPVEVAVAEPDPGEVKLRVDAALLEAETAHRAELDKLKKKLEKAEKEREKAEIARKSAEEKAQKAETEKKSEADKQKAEADAEILRLQKEAGELRAQLKLADAAVATFRVHFEAWQREYAAMEEALTKAEAETAEKLRGAIGKVIEGWSY